MTETLRPHPLDADDDDDQADARRYAPAGPTIAYKPLLKPSLVIAAVATVTLFVSSAITIITPLDSGVNIAFASISQASGVALILALGGVLVAFRVGYLSKQTSRRSWQLSDSFTGYNGLVLINTIGMAALWLYLLVLGSVLRGVVVAVTGPMIMTIAAGLLVTMIVWHQGYLRAFAIGCLTTLLLGLLPMVFFSSPLFFDLTSASRGGASPLNFVVMSTGITLTTAQLSGLISAGYVVAFESWGQRQPTTTPTHEQTASKLPV